MREKDWLATASIANDSSQTCMEVSLSLDEVDVCLRMVEMLFVLVFWKTVLPLKLVAVQMSLLIELGDNCFDIKEFAFKTTSVWTKLELTADLVDLKPDDETDFEDSDLSTGFDDLSNKDDDKEEEEPVDRAGKEGK